MDEKIVLCDAKAANELILQNLFSDETEQFFNSCKFTSDRMAFMQGMNYAALLCNARLHFYHGIIHFPQPPESEE